MTKVRMGDPAPEGITARLSTWSNHSPYMPICHVHALWKNGHIIVVQCALTLSPDVKVDYGDWESLDGDILRHESDYGLSIIQTLLPTIEFGRTNWAYLLKRADGSYHIVQKNRRIHQITFPTWAPLVKEQDIEITRWVNCDIRHGKWHGRDVDLLMSWDDTYAVSVEKEMRGHHLLQGFNITFAVLGHVVRDGDIVGIMTEPINGRAVQFSDKAQVYAAFSRLESAGLLYRGICDYSILITEKGDLRITNVCGVEQLAPGEGQAEFQFSYWNKLDDMFKRLAFTTNFLVHPRASTWIDASILPYIPSPYPVIDLPPVFWELAKGTREHENSWAAVSGIVKLAILAGSDTGPLVPRKSNSQSPKMTSRSYPRKRSKSKCKPSKLLQAVKDEDHSS